MAIYCWKCGAQVKEGRPDCQSCRTPIHRPGFWERVKAFFSPSYASKRSGSVGSSRRGDVREGWPVVSPLRNDGGAGGRTPEGPILDPTVLPPEVQQRLRDGEGVNMDLNDLPEEVREQFKALLDPASSGGKVVLRFGALPKEMRSETGAGGGASMSFNFSTKTSTIYKYCDASGKEHVCHSLEELPPEIRKAMENVGIQGHREG